MIGAIGSSLLFSVQNQAKASGSDSLEPSALELAADNGEANLSEAVFTSPGQDSTGESETLAAAAPTLETNNSENENNAGTNTSASGSDLFETGTNAAQERLGSLLDVQV